MGGWYWSSQQSFVEHPSFTRLWGYKHAVDIVPAFRAAVCGVLGRWVASGQCSKRWWRKIQYTLGGERRSPKRVGGRRVIMEGLVQEGFLGGRVPR